MLVVVNNFMNFVREPVCVQLLTTNVVRFVCQKCRKHKGRFNFIIFGNLDDSILLVPGDLWIGSSDNSPPLVNVHLFGVFFDSLDVDWVVNNWYVGMVFVEVVQPCKIPPKHIVSFIISPQG